MIPSISPRVVNMHYVSNGIYRSGDILHPDQTVPDVLDALYGITRVICLKNPHDDSPFEMEAERHVCEAVGMKWINIPMDNNGKFSYKDISHVPEILTLLKEQLPHGGCTLVHCHHGSDRTGVVIACYRMEMEHYTIDRAIKEMKAYGSAWYNWGMRNAVRDYGKGLGKGDEAKIR